MWVVSPTEGTVVRVDPDTNQPVSAPIAVGAGPTSVAVGDGVVWVVNHDEGTITRIDPATNKAIGEPIAVGRQPAAVALDGAWAWVVDQAGTLTRIDAGSGEPDGEPIALEGRPLAVAAGNGAVWVANRESGTVTRMHVRGGLSAERKVALWNIRRRTHLRFSARSASIPFVKSWWPSGQQDLAFKETFCLDASGGRRTTSFHGKIALWNISFRTHLRFPARSASIPSVKSCRPSGPQDLAFKDWFSGARTGGLRSRRPARRRKPAPSRPA